jgi:uncharacterized protein
MTKPNLGILVKPVSHDCNMSCGYCYYRPVSRLYPDDPRPRMALETVKAVCAQYRALGPREFKIGWQGGEPTLLGLEFFEQVVQIERRHASCGDRVGNSLQTNGLALDDDWCRFLAANCFLVGLSVDGPPDANAVRRLRDGRPAFEPAMRAIGLLKKHQVEFNILTVVSSANVEHPREVFQFLLDNDLHYAQLIPCTEPGEQPGSLSEHSVSASQYADFMIALFDAWIENDDPSYYVRCIDNWLHQFFGLTPESCEYRGDCSNLITIEHNGDVYPCDFFVDREHRLGNVRELTLEQMLRGATFRAFVQETRAARSACRACRWFAYCHGGCHRHRGRLGMPEGAPYLCEASQRIFSHVFRTLREVKERPVRPRLHAFMNSIESQIAAGLLDARGERTDAPAARARAESPRNGPCP